MQLFYYILFPKLFANFRPSFRTDLHSTLRISALRLDLYIISIWRAIISTRKLGGISALRLDLYIISIWRAIISPRKLGGISALRLDLYIISIWRAIVSTRKLGGISALRLDLYIISIWRAIVSTRKLGGISALRLDLYIISIWRAIVSTRKLGGISALRLDLYIISIWRAIVSTRKLGGISALRLDLYIISIWRAIVSTRKLGGISALRLDLYIISIWRAIISTRKLGGISALRLDLYIISIWRAIVSTRKLGGISALRLDLYIISIWRAIISTRKLGGISALRLDLCVIPTRYALLFLCISLHFHPLSAAIIPVCPNCQISSIEKGLKTAAECDTLLINGGTYEVENIVIQKSIMLKGENGATLISKGGDEILTILADHVYVSGLTFKGVTTSYLKERSAIRVKKRKYFQLTGNTILDCFFAIYLEHAKEGEVKGNKIIGNATTEAASGNGIHAWYCDEIFISNNEIQKHRDGIYFEFVNNSCISQNKSLGNKRYGLHFMFSNDDSYTENIFRGNGVGVAVMFSRRIQMIDNEFSWNWGRSSYGLLLKEIYDAEILENHFEQNTIGIFVEGSNRINYQYNQFLQNGWAIKFSGGCEDNEIHYNNFIHNSLDLVVNTKLASNRFHHNYWSNYSAYDLDKNGHGDVPYYPVKLFSYILDQSPESIVLMRSLFVDLVNFSEKVSPVFTPKEVRDDFPLMQAIDYDSDTTAP